MPKRANPAIHYITTNAEWQSHSRKEQYMPHPNGELVTQAMPERTLAAPRQLSAPGYTSPHEIGRHCVVNIGGTDQVVCFYMHCAVTGTVDNLKNFLLQPCQRRRGDEETRDSWGNVRP